MYDFGVVFCMSKYTKFIFQQTSRRYFSPSGFLRGESNSPGLGNGKHITRSYTKITLSHGSTVATWLTCLNNWALYHNNVNALPKRNQRLRGQKKPCPHFWKPQTCVTGWPTAPLCVCGTPGVSGFLSLLTEKQRQSHSLFWLTGLL